ncbi:AAA family ATPase, partial [bacterium]|nr:AAA family ATPase [bacterium]
MKHYNQHNEVKLTGKLAEFRIALQEEIEASKRSSANAAIRIINGRRIAQIGGNYQYVFNIENALNTPGDTPGDLKVSGHQPLEIIIVSIEGMKITISVPIDLGEYVKEAKLQSNLTQLMRKLIERIEDLSYFNNAVSERIISGSATGDLKTIKLDGLNREQNQAVASSLGRNLTFILGPPGTGKTKTIGSICSELFNNGRTVLLVSHTNIAVDQALLKISENLNLSAHDLHEGEILRVGEPKDPRLRDHNPELLLSTHVDRRSAELAKKRDELISEINVRTKKVIEISHTIDICEWVEIASKDIQKMSLDIEKLHEIEITLEENEVKQRELSKHDLSWTQSRKKATGIINDKVNLKNVEIQMKINEDILTNNNNESRLLMAQLKESEELYNNTVSVGWLTRTWRKLPTPEKQLDIVNDIKDKLCNCDNVLTQLNSDLYNLKNKRSGYLRSINSFLSEYKKKPEDIVNQANNHFTNYNTIKDQCRNLSKKAFRLRKECKEILGERLLILNEIGLASNHKSTVEEMLQAIRDAYQSAVSETTNYDLHTLRAVRNKLNQRIITIQSELNIIEKQLKSVVDYFISRAKIIATTLTRAYLRDSIQSRKFDTVILDEASMAPIPALWVAASISENNAVVVGDNKQLPPIVISKHKTAIKWLGRDIFDVNKISKRVILRRQYRMHPKISLIPNELVYDKILEDDNSVINREMNWYNYHWGFNTPVLLVDTSSLGAWVTSVCRGTSVSRLNFLSATICVDIAEKLFLNEIKSNSQEEHKVLIVCPYRPHAQLLSLLIRENKLDNVVLAGTAHSFQGSEADVVILDLVIGEPHWRAGIFNPEWDDQYIRLLNVALTRARHRLIIV